MQMGRRVFQGPYLSAKKSANGEQPLSVESGTLVFDSGGSWHHSSGIGGKGQLSSEYIEVGGFRYGYSICRFHFASLSIGSDVVVSVQGENSLEIIVDGNINIGSHLNLNGPRQQRLILHSTTTLQKHQPHQP